MSTPPAAAADSLFAQAVDAWAAVVESGSDDERIAVLSACERASRRLDRLAVEAVAALERRGTFAERGYKSASGAVADLLGCERFEARRRVVAAEQVVPRVGLDGAALPARLSATADMFAAGRASLRHVDVIAKVLGTKAAERLSPEQWAGAESALADKTGDYTPSELQAWGTALVEALADVCGYVLDHGSTSLVPECGDRPPSWSEVHHIREWELGGETALSKLVMLCTVHHRQTHFTEWVVRIRDGLPEFIPPKWLDMSQTPRRKAHPQLVGIRP
jgi:Domain of unknown function (DUF222)